MKIHKVIRRVHGDGTSALNAVVTANIGETGEAGATSVQRVGIVQRHGGSGARKRPNSGARERRTSKES